MSESSLSQHARDLYERALIWDAHSGFTPDPSADLNQLNRWRDAGVDHLSIDVGDVLPWEQVIRTIAAFRHWILQHNDRFALVSTVEDISRARQAGQMAVTFDLEGINALDGRLEMIELYHRLGVRQMILAYNRNGLAGGGCHDEDTGLTAFGRAAIAELNRLGMFVDLSHCGHRTSMEAMDHSQQPVIFSHSNARALCDHERNISDDQIKACAATGGVVGAVGVNVFLGTNEVTAERLADHVEYLLDITGPQHVGIGLDYSFPSSSAGTRAQLSAHPEYWPPERGYADVKLAFAPPTVLSQLADTLLARGHSDDVVLNVLGGNFLRLAQQVWK